MKQIIIGLFIMLLVACNQQPVQGTVKMDTPRDTVYNTTYKDGTDCMCDSIQSYYYDSGVLMWEIPYINGKEHGVCKWYHESGALMREIPRINGNVHGVVKSYYKSGALRWEIPCINEKEHGVGKWYYENGKLAGTATYKNGKLAGYKKCSDGRVGNENLDCLK